MLDGFTNFLSVAYGAIGGETSWDDVCEYIVPFLVGIGCTIVTTEADSVQTIGHAGVIEGTLRELARHVLSKEKAILPQVKADAFCINSDGTLITKSHTGKVSPPPGGNHILGNACTLEDGRPLLLLITRLKEQTPFDATSLNLLNNVFTVLQKPVATHLSLRRSEMQAQAQSALLDALPFGVVFVAHNGAFFSSNALGRQMLEAADGIHIGLTGAIECSEPSERIALAALIRNTLDPVPQAGTGRLGSMRIHRPSGATPYSLLASPLVLNTCKDGASASRAVLIISEPGAAGLPQSEVVAALFSLTPAEARVALALCQFGSVEDAAANVGYTAGSFRSTLKRVFAKTETQGQADLVRTLLLSTGGLSLRPPAA